MSTTRERQRQLRRIMRVNRLTSAAVGLILNRAASHVRAWKTGYHPMPEQMMRLLELELERRTRPQEAPAETAAQA